MKDSILTVAGKMNAKASNMTDAVVDNSRMVVATAKVTGTRIGRVSAGSFQSAGATQGAVMYQRLIKLFFCFVVLATTLTGCAINRATATADPSFSKDTIKTMHVVKIKEESGGINVLIADTLRRKGFRVTTSEDKVDTVDAVVTYVDKWMWDITMYLLELTVTIRDTKSEFPLATGNSYHTSLTRKSPNEMVDEVMGNIFVQGKM